MKGKDKSALLMDGNTPLRDVPLRHLLAAILLVKQSEELEETEMEPDDAALALAKADRIISNLAAPIERPVTKDEREAEMVADALNTIYNGGRPPKKGG